MSRQTNLRTFATARASSGKGKAISNSGSITVSYRDTKGRRHDAVVVGPGTSSGLKLRIRGQGSAIRVIDNVALGTARNQTNVYFTFGA
jgi:hypothetical protein